MQTKSLCRVWRVFSGKKYRSRDLEGHYVGFKLRFRRLEGILGLHGDLGPSRGILGLDGD